jgi:hypothetical protein
MLKARRILFEGANKMLRPAGLCLSRVEADFQTSRPHGALDDIVRGRLAAVWGGWYDAMSADASVELEPMLSKTEFTDGIVRFLSTYAEFSGKNVRSGGLFLNNTVSLYAVASFFSLPTIIDSGTHTGNSAWALSTACPEATIHSFDLTNVALAHRAPRVQYHLNDWTETVKDPLPDGTAFGFFDDHVDQVRRIEECAVRRVRYLLFDDDVPLAASHTGHNPASFPKVSWAFSEELADCPRVEWMRMGKAHAVAVDQERLRRARECVQHYSRLPDLYPCTGCRYQWPLSLVVLRPTVTSGGQGES